MSWSQGFLDDNDKIRRDPLDEPCRIEEPTEEPETATPERNPAREQEITFQLDGNRRWAVATFKGPSDKWVVVKSRIPLMDHLSKERQEWLTIRIAEKLRNRVDRSKKYYGVK